ncbi:MAG TPA: glycosyltransferase family 4 protein [Terracidiphilus sp.]|jgi:glycosyltransferase involved in cell wall biosynthesis
MKSICIVSQSDYDIDPRVRRKAEALAAAGYQVDVLALRPPNREANYSVNGVNVKTFALGKKRGSLARYAYEYAAFLVWACFHITRGTQKSKYSVIDVNTLPDFLIFAAAFAKVLGAKVVLDMHEITPEFYMSKYGVTEKSWRVRLCTFLEKMSFDFADQVITINHPIQELLRKRGLPLEKSMVITNSADDARFTNTTARREIAPADHADRFVMMYHGTLTKIYGLDIAIEAFALVHKEIPGAEIWILGQGPEVGLLQELIQKHDLSSKVKLVGSVPSAEIPEWLAKCDIGILPIRRDVFLEFAFPNKLPEFILSGKTAIVSRLGAIRYYFDEDAVAYFEPCDAADLSRQMVRMYEDQKLRVSLASQAKKQYAPIRWDVMKRRYLDLIGELSESKSREREIEAVSR